MPKQELNIAVMIGSIRQDRQTIKPAKALIKLLKDRGVKTVVLDLQALDLPMFDDGISHKGKTKLLNAYKKMDGIIIVSPEYNHSIPSPVKNAIDFARDNELSGKPLAIMGTSSGSWGGARMLSQLRNAWIGVGGIALPIFSQVPHVTDFKATDEWTERTNRFLDQSIDGFMTIKKGMQK